MEAWINPSVISSSENNIVATELDGGSVGGVVLGIKDSGDEIYLATQAVGYTVSATVTSTIPTNTWTHIAAVVNGTGSNETDIYINGTRETQGTFSSTFSGSYAAYVGEDGRGNGDFNGYISNARISDNARYSGASFTVPTAPFASDSNTLLLTSQSNRFIDNSSTGRSISLSGTPKVSTNTPFTQSKTANVGSGYFDQTDDHVEVATASSDFNLGTGQFTFEAWVYTQSTDQQTIMIAYVGTTDFNIYLHYDAVSVYTSTEIINGDDGAVESFIQKNAWNHVVVQRDSSNYLTLYVNGVRKYYTVVATDFGATSKIRIGEHENNGNGFKGYIADVRFVKGSAVYSGATITVPTSSLTSTGSETKLLTCQYSGAVRNVGFLDDSKYNHQITRNGDVSLGTFSPFSLEEGYWSNYISPNSGLKFPNSSAFAFGTGAFTIEFWVLGGADNDQDFILEGRVAVGTLHITFGGYGGTTSNGFRYVGSSTISTTDLIADNTWHHCVAERDASNNVTLYIDGVSKATGTDTNNYTTTTGDWGIGHSNSAGSNYSNAYFSNFRIVKGSNVYGGAFSVPTAPLTAVTNTQLLTCQSNRFVDNSSNGLTLTLVGTPKVQPFSPLAPSRSYSKDAVGGSAYFDNDGDYLETATSSSLDFNANQFCIEWWEYRTARGNFDIVMHIGFDASTSYGLVIGYQGNKIYWSSGSSSWDVIGGSNFFGNETRYDNQWYHCVLTRDSSNQFRAFINGVLRYTTSVSTNIIYQAANAIAIGTGQTHDTSHDYEGYLSGINISNGSIPSRYQTSSTTVDTSIFTPPTAPTTSDTDTVLLLNYANAGIIDHTMKNNLETEGNTRIRTDVKKFGTGSIFLDGSDELNINDDKSETFSFGTGLFTIEAFIRVESGSDASGQWFTNEGHGGWGGGAISVYLQSAFTVWFNDYDTGASFMSYDGNYDDGVMRHYAIVRGASGACALFVNGTRVATGTHTGNVGRTGGMGIGNYKDGSRQLTGFIDEMRVTKGVARYDPSQSSVTIPTGSFANR
jgi:hypothetical protein